MRAVFVGSDTLLLQCVDLWTARGHTVVAIATDADKVRRFCAERELPCIDAAALAQLPAGCCDHLFAITWLRLLPPAVLQLPSRSAINFHDGPLPRYAGLNAPCWAILNGEREHGVTWHRIEPQADTGAILVQQRFAIAADDTALLLNARCFQAGQETWVQLVDQLQQGTLQPRAQDLAARTVFARAARPAHLAVVDWRQDAAAVLRLCRAFDHGSYQNPVAAVKLWLGEVALQPGRTAPRPASNRAPGTVVACDDGGMQVALRGGDLRFDDLRTLDNQRVDQQRLQAFGVRPGLVLPALDAGDERALADLAAATARHDRAWLGELAAFEPTPLPGAVPHGSLAEPHELPLLEATDLDPDTAAALCLLFLARATGSDAVHVGLQPGPRPATPLLQALLLQPVPLRCAADFAATTSANVAAARAALAAARARGPLLRELVVRNPDRVRAGHDLSAVLVVQFEGDARPAPVRPGTATFAVGSDGAVRLCFDAAALPRERAEAWRLRLQRFVAAARSDGAAALRDLPLLDDAELQRVVAAGRGDELPPPAEPCVHRQFAAQAQRTPNATALRCGDRTRTYRECERDVAALAARLHALGVRRGDRVGICLSRDLALPTAVLAVFAAGACYVPLDPAYPPDRLQFMADDAGLAALVVDATTRDRAPQTRAARLDVDVDAAPPATAGDSVPPDAATGDDLAYLIYTSGSTGRPKGVMVRHRNAANFFLGMDRVLGSDAPGTWLAVTSLSFDISVLELLWTLCRGFTVVVHQGEGHAAHAATAPATTARPLTFSLFYFASDEGAAEADKYRLLLDGARFADQHGFEAVWTPERHFHAFGGLYPNPAVASAAIAAITQRVQIRAGSCVSPLHSPIRIAEDWALVDNLSGGRVGISFAAGWQPNDFVLQPQNFADRKQRMFADIATVHALWRGERVPFPGHDGKPVLVRTLPRPVQPTLPTWVTVAGNPETFRQAGEAGAFVLTHLLGQSFDELRDKLAVYRQAWRSKSHAGEGRVTLMLHTFVGDDEPQVRAAVHGPLKEYLRSSVDLIRQAAGSFPAFKQRTDGSKAAIDALFRDGLSAADLDALLEFAFERYYRTSGLFGTVDGCLQTIARLRELGVDECACLIDYGIPRDVVQSHLPHLLRLKQRSDALATKASTATASSARAPAAPRATIPQQIERCAVTHLQCTPSMAAMLLVDPAAAPALRRLRHLLVGGEALAPALAQQLRALVANLHDVYGPTETTVWSTSWLVGDDEPVPIGRPLANQTVYVLDPARSVLPFGDAGELWIGGAGVTAGYHGQPELTQERFVADPFAQGHDREAPRMYRTGDLARFRSDGALEYLGRADFQVKVRGHRIELGEIEAVLARCAGVREVVVVAQQAGAAHDARLCAYFVAAAGAPAPTPDQLREQARQALPEFMVPQHFVPLPDLPRTPNQKVDRKALPAPAAPGARPRARAADAIEDAIVAVWQQALGTRDVGVEDNFFDVGGHSILAVQVHRQVQEALRVTLQVTDLFRFTTVRALAAHVRSLQQGSAAPTAAQAAMARAKARRDAQRRR